MSSNYTVEDSINLYEKLQRLKLEFSSNFCILPENIEEAEKQEDFIFTDTSIIVKKIFQNNNIPIEIIRGSNTKYRQRKSIDWHAPTIFIGYALLSENSMVASIGLNVLSNYVSDFFKGTFGEKKVKLEIIVETGRQKTYKRIKYEGNVEGLKDLNQIIKSLNG